MIDREITARYWEWDAVAIICFSPQRASPAETIDGKELVGTKHKVKIHVHKHETYTIPRSTSGESYGCTCTSPGYVAYDGTSSPGYVVYDGSSSPGYVVYDGSSSNPAVAQPSSQPMVQVYQVPSVPSVQGASYSPNANYAVLPSSYSNYVSSFNYPSASSFNFCPQSLNSAPPLVYRLIWARRDLANQTTTLILYVIYCICIRHLML